MNPEKIKVIFTSEVESTNLHASDLLSGKQVKPPFVVYSGFQKKGKGQGGNVWYSERDMNLLCSICVEPDNLKVDQNFYLSKIAALSVYSMLNKLHSKVEIKWPNDILLNGKKIAGILIENIIRNDQVLRSIVGIGLNVNQTSFPPFKPEAISMKMETNIDYNIDGILTELLSNFSKWYSGLEQNDKGSIDLAYVKQLYLYRQYADFRIDGKIVKGCINEILNDGRMLFKKENGEVTAYGFKEIEFI